MTSSGECTEKPSHSRSPSPLTPHPSTLNPQPSTLTPHPQSSPNTPHRSPITPHPPHPHPSPFTPTQAPSSYTAMGYEGTPGPGSYEAPARWPPSGPSSGKSRGVEGLSKAPPPRPHAWFERHPALNGLSLAGDFNAFQPLPDSTYDRRLRAATRARATEAMRGQGTGCRVQATEAMRGRVHHGRHASPQPHVDETARVHASLPPHMAALRRAASTPSLAHTYHDYM